MKQLRSSRSFRRSEQRRRASLNGGLVACLEILEKQDVTAQRLPVNGHIFEARNSNNSILQRANSALIAMKPGGSLPGNPLKSLKKMKRREQTFQSNLSRMTVRRLVDGAFFPWRARAEYYYGSAAHKPPLPPVDSALVPKIKKQKVSAKRKKRTVQVKVVDECVRSGTLKILDNVNGVYVPDKFMKLPKEEGQEQTQDLFKLLRNMDQKALATQSYSCRDDTEGERVVAFDGRETCYMSLGYTTNKHGPGFKLAMDNEMSKPGFIKYLCSIERRCKKYLPDHVLDVFQVLRTYLPVDLPPVILKDTSLWTSWAIGMNVFLNRHVDDDWTWSCCGVVAEDDDMESIVCYLVFPRLGVAVPLRNGDAIVFNARVEHCISSRCNPNRDAYYVGFYINSGLGAKNDRKVDVSEEQKNRAAWMSGFVREAKKGIH